MFGFFFLRCLLCYFKTTIHSGNSVNRRNVHAVLNRLGDYQNTQRKHALSLRPAAAQKVARSYGIPNYHKGTGPGRESLKT